MYVNLCRNLSHMYFPKTILDLGTDEQAACQKEAKRARLELVRDMRDMTNEIRDDVRKKISSVLERLFTHVSQLEAALYYSAWMLSILIEPEAPRKKSKKISDFSKP